MGSDQSKRSHKVNPGLNGQGQRSHRVKVRGHIGEIRGQVAGEWSRSEVTQDKINGGTLK